jgi:soluble lytic murein transglycosylase
LLTAVPETDDQPTAQLVADELFFLGLFDEAVPEYTFARSAASTPKPAEGEKQGTVTATGLTDFDYSMAVYALKGGLANRAIRFAESVWRTIPPDYAMELAPAELIELLYPAPYRESLLRHTSQRGVDPRFVLSIARQESRFQADAKSVAAARGLMQFIPATADEIAKQLGGNVFDYDELYNPDTATLFGSQYLANLFQRFPGQAEAVASAYNGGPDNTARWVNRSRSGEADRYVPEIGFSQTKDYVYKVMKNFWIYQQLYDAKLERK